MSTSAEAQSSESPLKRGLMWTTLQAILYAFFRVWLGYRAVGYKPMEVEQGALILANHQSFLDPLLIGMPLHRPISFLARHTLFPVPVIGWILKNTHVMSINQQATSTVSLRETIARLQSGWLVGIFPEGTRTQTGGMVELKPGFSAIVRRCKRPVYPVGISGAYQALPMGSCVLKPVRVRVVFGQPISVEELEQYSGRDQDAALVELVESRIAACFEAAESWRTTGKEPAISQ